MPPTYGDYNDMTDRYNTKRQKTWWYKWVSGKLVIAEHTLWAPDQVKEMLIVASCCLRSHIGDYIAGLVLSMLTLGDIGQIPDRYSMTFYRLGMVFIRKDDVAFYADLAITEYQIDKHH